MLGRDELVDYQNVLKGRLHFQGIQGVIQVTKISVTEGEVISPHEG
jgi:hypothetical protein